MKFNSKQGFILLFVVVSALAAWDMYSSKQAEKKIGRNEMIFTNPLEQVDKIQIVNSKGEILLLRGIEGWKMFKPIEDIADNEYVESFLDSLKEDRIIDVVTTEEEIDWSKYGLSPAPKMITLTTSAGKINSLQVSEKRNFEDHVFARKDSENKIILVNAVWQDRLNRNAMDFRERRVFRHKVASVDELEIKFKNENYKFNRVDGQWKIVSKDAPEIDQNKFRELLTEFSKAKGSDLLEKLPPQLVPMFSIKTAMDGKLWNVNLFQAEDFGIYVAISDPKIFMKLEAGALDYFIDFNLKNLLKEPPAEQNPNSEVSK